MTETNRPNMFAAYFRETFLTRPETDYRTYHRRIQTVFAWLSALPWIVGAVIVPGIFALSSGNPWWLLLSIPGIILGWLFSSFVTWHKRTYFPNGGGIAW